MSPRNLSNAPKKSPPEGVFFSGCRYRSRTSANHAALTVVLSAAAKREIKRLQISSSSPAARMSSRCSGVSRRGRVIRPSAAFHRAGGIRIPDLTRNTASRPPENRNRISDFPSPSTFDDNDFLIVGIFSNLYPAKIRKPLTKTRIFVNLFANYCNESQSVDCKTNGSDIARRCERTDFRRIF